MVEKTGHTMIDVAHKDRSSRDIHKREGNQTYLQVNTHENKISSSEIVSENKTK